MRGNAQLVNRRARLIHRSCCSFNHPAFVSLALRYPRSHVVFHPFELLGKYRPPRSILFPSYVHCTSHLLHSCSSILSTRLSASTQVHWQQYFLSYSTFKYMYIYISIPFQFRLIEFYQYSKILFLFTLFPFINSLYISTFRYWRSSMTIFPRFTFVPIFRRDTLPLFIRSSPHPSTLPSLFLSPLYLFLLPMQ